ncbi:hypothetical protein QQP08_004103 [Theobroma cacao]|nr:hypothetical protein QQP08_004103 [Theobroma cacao]
MGWCLYIYNQVFGHPIVYSSHEQMDANPCLLVFMLVLGLGLLLSHTTHVVEAVSAPSSADANVPSFDFPYKFKAVSKRLEFGRLRPPPPIPHRPPQFKPPIRRPPPRQRPYKRKSPPPLLPRSPPPPSQPPV